MSTQTPDPQSPESEHMPPTEVSLPPSVSEVGLTVGSPVVSVDVEGGEPEVPVCGPEVPVDPSGVLVVSVSLGLASELAVSVSASTEALGLKQPPARTTGSSKR
jgi:hypothetical protein